MSARHKCTSLSRYSLIVLNTCVAIVSLAVIGLALWVRFDANFEQQLRNDLLNANDQPPDFHIVKNQIRTAITVSFWVIIGFSAASLILSLFGILAAAAQNRTAYILYMVVLVIMILLELAIGIFIIIYRPNIKTVVDSYTSMSFQYGTSDSKSLMERYECCGDGTSNLYNQQCLQIGSQLVRDCPAAVWERLTFHLMITGLVMLGVIVVKLLAAMFSFIVILNHRYRTLID